MTGKRQVPGRVTRQQMAVAELLASTADFRSAQQIHAALGDRGERIGLATVYRILAGMAASGAVDTLVRDERETLYRRCSGLHHHHLVCRRCGRTVEIAGPDVERWAEAVAAAHGFTDVRHQVELFGVCPECRTRSDPGA